MEKWSEITEIGPGFTTGFAIGLIAACLCFWGTVNKYKALAKQAEVDGQHQVEYVREQCKQLINACNKD